MPANIGVHGLDEFRTGVDRLAADMPDVLETAALSAADLVAGYARPRVPRRSGRAARTLRAMVTRPGRAEVTAGGSAAPYFGWLDFGGRVGRGNGVRRPYRKTGRYIFAGLDARESAIEEAQQTALTDAATSARLGVD